ncbi:hypothetical protein SRABI44_03046 [Microbacterium foliorum]|nr:hypothetical protein SRABI03_02736 [Microbacterium foliorum]CAH0246488.1 hypothetical protein SRABI44_03046 [Microbacterium foliorum]
MTSRSWKNRSAPVKNWSSSGSQILTAPTSSATIQVTMLDSASQSGRFGASPASRMAMPANAASRRIVRNARPIRPSWSPISTHTTHTSAAAISAPMAIQIAPRMRRDMFFFSTSAGGCWAISGCDIAFLS